jgi:SP family arabinose:H+ symporter-like MFS transporter
MNNSFDSKNREGRVWELVLICAVASLAGLLFGFDTAVISGTVERVASQYQLSKIMEGWFASSALAGCILGAPIAGFVGDRFGRKPTLIISAVLFFVSALYSMIPQTFNTLIIARAIGGIGVGMASVLAPMYISEFAPAKWRGRLVAFYQLSIVIGILLAYLSNWLLLRLAQAPPPDFTTHETLNWIFVSQFWRGMFGAELIPAGLFFFLLWLVPESPRWLLQAGRDVAALDVLTRINGLSRARQEISEIRRGIHTEHAPLRELFRPGIRLALLVGVMLSVFGQLSGVNIVVYYGPKILMAAGYQDAAALLGQVGFGLINLVFTIIALLLIDKWGRRPLLIGGMAVVTLTLSVIGALFLFGGSGVSSLVDSTGTGTVSRTMGLWIVAMICVYMACIALSICAVIWVLTPEIFPTRLRGRATSIATFSNWLTNGFSALVFPWYVAQLGMHSFFFTTAFICLVATWFFWKYVPETKGRSLEDIEKIWLGPQVRTSNAAVSASSRES